MNELTRNDGFDGSNNCFSLILSSRPTPYGIVAFVLPDIKSPAAEFPITYGHRMAICRIITNIECWLAGAESPLIIHLNCLVNESFLGCMHNHVVFCQITRIPMP